jgi:predicted  nucleic acid-binding Zn ribbon protein
MKWLVRFHQQQYHCCPPGKYWVAKSTVIDSDSAESAVKEVLDAWRYNHKIEIKSVEEYNNDKQGQ